VKETRSEIFKEVILKFKIILKELNLKMLISRYLKISLVKKVKSKLNILLHKKNTIFQLI
jgi:hypothetical protein